MKTYLVVLIFLLNCYVKGEDFILAGDQEVRLWEWTMGYISRTKNPPMAKKNFIKSLLAMRKNKGTDPETVKQLIKENYKIISFSPSDELKDFDYSKNFFANRGHVYSKATFLRVSVAEKTAIKPIKSSEVTKTKEPIKSDETTAAAPNKKAAVEIKPNPVRREVIPSFHQANGFKGGNNQCTINAFVNSLKWWGENGLITERDEKKIHKNLLKERGKGKKSMRGMAKAMTQFLSKYGNNKQYNFKIVMVPVTIQNLSVGVSGENIASLTFDNSRGGSHMVTLTDYDPKTNIVYFNTWGKRYQAQLVQHNKKWLVQGFKSHNMKYYLRGKEMVIVIPSAKKRRL